MTERSDNPSEPASRLAFRGGFAVLPDASRTLPADVQHWKELRFADRLVRYDADVPVAVAHGPSTSVAVLGTVIAPYARIGSSHEVATYLAAAEGTACLDRVDELTGRFALLVHDGRTCWALIDASASRGLARYQDEDGSVWVSSHATLLGELIGLNRDERARMLFRLAAEASRSRVNHLPGMLTPVDGVRSLSPNHRLDLSTGAIQRIFPRRRRRARRLGSVVRETAEILESSMRLITAGHSARISLTAGLDSRTTFASARSCLDRIETFSYVNSANPNRTHLTDLGVAAELSSRAGVRHHTVELDDTPENPPDPAFRRAWLRNLGLPRGLERLNREFARTWPHGVLHVRSNVAEVAQAFYSQGLPDGTLAAGLAKRWHPLGAHPDSIAVIEDMTLAYGLRGDIAGYDLRDLFYWEHRLPQWYSWLCLEADMSHDTFCPFGNRRLLVGLLALSRQRRVAKVAFTGVIERLWPELLKLPINPSTWPPE